MTTDEEDRLRALAEAAKDNHGDLDWTITDPEETAPCLDFIAACCPDAILALLDDLAELRSALLSQQVPERPAGAVSCSGCGGDEPLT